MTINFESIKTVLIRVDYNVPIKNDIILGLNLEGNETAFPLKIIKLL